MKVTTTTGAVVHPSYEATSIRARELWEQSGRPVGRDEEFWFEAERQLRAPVATTTSVASTPAVPISGRPRASGSGSTKIRDGDNIREKTDELLNDIGGGENRSPTALNIGDS